MSFTEPRKARESNIDFETYTHTQHVDKTLLKTTHVGMKVIFRFRTSFVFQQWKRKKRNNSSTYNTTNVWRKHLSEFSTWTNLTKCWKRETLTKLNWAKVWDIQTLKVRYLCNTNIVSQIPSIYTRNKLALCCKHVRNSFFPYIAKCISQCVSQIDTCIYLLEYV